jgi:hypothetical protein
MYLDILIIQFFFFELLNTLAISPFQSDLTFQFRSHFRIIDDPSS